MDRAQAINAVVDLSLQPPPPDSHAISQCKTQGLASLLDQPTSVTPLGKVKGGSLERTAGLDVMRSIAIGLVLLSHTLNLLRLKFHVAGWAVVSGYFGVEVFFVLSGFLIGRILIEVLQKDASGPAVWNFLRRRWFRTLPNYFLFLAINLAIAAHFGGIPSGLWRFFLFLQNSSATAIQFFTESWSLAIEEWFYLATPLLMLGVIRFGRLKARQGILLTACAVLLTVTAARIALAATRPESSWGLDFRASLVLRQDACMYGVLGAWLSIYLPKWWERWRALGMVLGLIGLITALWTFFCFVPVKDSIHGKTTLFTITSLSIFLLLPALSSWKRIGGPVGRCFQNLSIWSYSVYLINFRIFALAETYVGKNVRASTTSAFAICAAVIALVILLARWNYQLFEKPMLKLRDRKAEPRAEKMTELSGV